jgi:hypothetical protein
MKIRILWSFAAMALVVPALCLPGSQGHLTLANDSELVRLTHAELAAARGLGDASECCNLTSSDACNKTNGCPSKDASTEEGVANCDTDGKQYAGETTHVCSETGADPNSVCQNGNLAGCWVKKKCPSPAATTVSPDSKSNGGTGCEDETGTFCRPCGFTTTIATQGMENDDCSS